MSQQSTVRKAEMLPSPSRKARQTIQLDDRKTWTTEFCIAMKKPFSGNGHGEIYSWWERCRMEIENYNYRKEAGQNIGHPLTTQHAVGRNRILLRAISNKEMQVAYALPGFEVS